MKTHGKISAQMLQVAGQLNIAENRFILRCTGALSLSTTRHYSTQEIRAHAIIRGVIPEYDEQSVRAPVGSYISSAHS
jgi:hypothetical protein